MPLSFANLKSLKWLDLKKNPLNSKLAAIAGNCGTDAECKQAAKQVVDVYMGEQKKAIDSLKAQEAKHKAKVQKAQEEERMKKNQEKKEKAAAKKGTFAGKKTIEIFWNLRYQSPFSINNAFSEFPEILQFPG